MGLKVENMNITAKLKDNQEERIVKGLSFSIEQGQKLAVAGCSGCGKTMTAMAVLGLLPENCRAEGKILWNNLNLSEISAQKRRQLLGRKMVLIPQSGADFLNPSLKIKTQMKEALSHTGIIRKERRAYGERLLEQAGLNDAQRVLNSYPFQLSGGMAQRVVMAFASAGEPELVIADEPTKGIDQSNVEIFLSNLDRLFSKAAVLLITHDISVASACDSLLVMKDGIAEEYGETNRVLREPKSPYTQRLLADLPGRGYRYA